MMKVEVYTDGSATTGDKPGGFAYVVVVDGKKYAECSGSLEQATNNDAELSAAIEGLKAVYRYLSTIPEGLLNAEVTLCSDSQLVLGWASGAYRFKQLDKLERFNQLSALMKALSAGTRWVKGHSGDEFNERCDYLANQARLSVGKQLDRAEAKARGETLIGTKKSGVMAVWYKGNLKVIDLETNIVENYDREIHGPRGSMLEIREEKSR